MRIPLLLALLGALAVPPLPTLAQPAAEQTETPAPPRPSPMPRPPRDCTHPAPPTT